MRARTLLIIGIFVALIAIAVGTPLRCGSLSPQYCVGKIVEITNFDDSTTRVLVQSVTLRGQPFEYAGNTFDRAEDDFIYGVTLDNTRYVFLNVDATRRLREVGALDWIVDALLVMFVVAMALLVLILVAVDRRRQLRPAPPSFSPPLHRMERGPGGEGDTLTSSIFDNLHLPITSLRESGLPIDEMTYLAIGGGMGSFAWVNNLRVFGAPITQIVVLSLSANPYESYRQLCHHSQLFDDDRLRSDSGATPDNLWGWPGYAVREAGGEFMRGQFNRAVSLAWQVFAEPAFAETYTPRSGDVYQSIDREAARIGWRQMHRTGVAYCIRKTDDDRYAVLYDAPGADGWQQRVMIARSIHIATGYSGVRILPDMQTYRDRTGDTRCAVNAYEDHSHIYRQLADEGGMVLIRGRGIVASQILQRLYEVRAQNPHIKVLHLMRQPLSPASRIGRTRRAIDNHWQFQPFNWPKSTFGGYWQARLAQAGDAEQKFLFEALGGVTTANRRAWRAIIQEGLREGWYQTFFGCVNHIEQYNNRVVVAVDDSSGSECASFAVNYIIDCTGLESDLDSDPLLGDLCQHYNLELNPYGRIATDDNFEIRRMRSGAGRVYTAGVIAFGGKYAPVDSFMGLQYAALRSVDALAEQGAPGLRRLDGVHSLAQWLYWCWGAQP